ncbi:MAG: hypothetical protein KAQ79_18435 [Cyclobacteriaceae bacterium]|nr:hypothetical protein [Cyclobacteriaceae bacterium]
MGFIPISIDHYVKKHIKNNPKENKKELIKRLNSALRDYKNGVKCSCGNDIWVVGSAVVGNSCFTCITGESHPKDDYEIDSAIKKRENKIGQRHIDDMDPTKIAGLFDDDGYEINTDLINKPSLCLTCINDDNPNEEISCNLTRHDQRDEKEFICFAYKKRS